MVLSEAVGGTDVSTLHCEKEQSQCLFTYGSRSSLPSVCALRCGGFLQESHQLRPLSKTIELPNVFAHSSGEGPDFKILMSGIMVPRFHKTSCIARSDMEASLVHPVKLKERESGQGLREELLLSEDGILQCVIEFVQGQMMDKQMNESQSVRLTPDPSLQNETLGR